MSLNSHTWKLINEALDVVIDLPTSERAPALKRLNLAPDILSEVESLLLAHDTSEKFLTKSAADKALSAIQGSERRREFEAGERIDQFKILSRLGQGGTATVYLAEDLSLGRRVALKVKALHGQEAQTMATLEHDNIVRVFSENIDTHRGMRIICMQHIAGPTLQAFISRSKDRSVETGKDFLNCIDALSNAPPSRNPFDINRREFVENCDPIELVCWFGATLAEALAFAHDRNILHLDIKPANILIDQYGRPFLADFSISKNCTLDIKDFGGTQGYMSPEHLLAFQTGKQEYLEAITAQADIFAIGVVLKELLSAVCAHCNEQSKTHLEYLLDQCTQSDVTRRPTSAAALSRSFQNVFELRRSEKQLPKLRGLFLLARRHPVISILVVTLAPQVFGSLVNIVYNFAAILENFSAADRVLFQKVTLIYNIIVYPTCIALYVYSLWPLRKKNLSRPSAQVRKKVLNIPLLISFVTSLGWLPGGILFPYFIHTLGAGLPRSTFIHFAASFALSWIVALSYSAVFAQAICVRSLYPRLLIEEAEPTAVARRELSGIHLRIRFFQALAVLVPLASAAVLVTLLTQSPDGNALATFRWQMLLIIGVGVAGVFAVGTASEKTRKVISILTAN